MLFVIEVAAMSVGQRFGLQIRRLRLRYTGDGVAEPTNPPVAASLRSLDDEDGQPLLLESGDYIELE